MMEDGQLFKKIWKSVPIEEYMNEEGQKVYPEFRIINKETTFGDSWTTFVTTGAMLVAMLLRPMLTRIYQTKKAE